VSGPGDTIALLDHPITGDDRGCVAWIDAQQKVTRVTDEWSGLKGLAWAANGREIWFSGSKWRPITPEGTSSVMVAPNGKYVIARSELNGFQ
jgi:hypothetical protein